MADPKYANLPGIAHDQPDIYETGDLPECDLYISDSDEISNSVETLHVTATDALGKVKGKQVTRDINVSAAIRENKRHEYVVWNGDYELAGTGSCPMGTETPLQKYQRLNCEVRELLEELDLAKHQAVENEGTEKHAQSLVGIATQTTQLQDQLSKLKLEEMLGSDLVKQLDDPRSAAKEKLISQLKAVNEVSVVTLEEKNTNLI